MLKTTRYALALAALLGFGGAAQAAPALASLPAGFQGNAVFLKVRLNGASPVWMLFDPNAPESSITAAQFDTDARSAARIAARMTVTAGAARQDGVFFDLVAAVPVTAPDGKPVAGRLGRNWLGDRALILVARRHEVLLAPPIDTGAPPPIVAASYTVPAAR